MKIVTVIGARPQFVKAATVSRVIAESDNVSEVIIHTGQHFDTNMSEVFFTEMKIPKPDYQFSINGLSHGAMTGQMIEEIEKVLFKEKPDWLLVYGDTNSTLAGALAAAKLNIKIAHIEAGLRSFNMKMPEEQNRILTDRISTVLFCPTEQAVKNLEDEGYNNIGIRRLNVGDVMFDAANFYSQYSHDKSSIKDIEPGFILVTCHRAENTDDFGKLKGIIDALNELSKNNKLVFPIHPRTKKILEQNSIKLDFETIEPVGYFDMIEFLKNCSLVLTDSGGLQKEAYFFDRLCVTMREETEWVELVNAGVNRLAGADQKQILEASYGFLGKEVEFPKNLYGDGRAAQKIVKHLIQNT